MSMDSWSLHPYLLLYVANVSTMHIICVIQIISQFKERGQRSGIDTIKHHQWENDNFTIRYHKRKPSGQPFSSRWPQGIKNRRAQKHNKNMTEIT